MILVTDAPLSQIQHITIMTLNEHANEYELAAVAESRARRLIYSVSFPIFSYRESAARISKSIRLHPRSPVQQAADWVEYTQAQGDLARLRPRGLDLPFYQLYLLDVISVFILLLMGAFGAVYLFLGCFCRLCSEKISTKEKSL